MKLIQQDIKLSGSLKSTQLICDRQTPIAIYQKVRDLFPVSLLLESADHHALENCYSYIVFDELASIVVQKTNATLSFSGEESDFDLKQFTFSEIIQQFTEQINCVDVSGEKCDPGFYGYTSFDAISHFTKIPFHSHINPAETIPDMVYSFFRFVLKINFFNNDAELIEFVPEGEHAKSNIILKSLLNASPSNFSFQADAKEVSYTRPDEFLNQVQLAKTNCYQGDVFQLVLSRRFSKKFIGDDINVYRALRSINPSPYLFYYDHGDFRLMGSSPEAQLIVKQGKAEIHPIAGTFRRTGNDEKDVELAKQLSQDEKENAEHVMLVDLARNDLSKHCTSVTVEKLQQIEFYSHVIHMVSKVTGKLNYENTVLDLQSYSFPAGTLSGAPKHRALELIREYENHARGFYGGCIGFTDFKKNNNQAILIRSLLSRNNELYYQAGAGIVADSIPENELQEIDNKLAVIRKAIELAQQL